MITGAHVLLSSKNAEADRAFLRDVLELKHIDIGDGWLIFALPPSEIGVSSADLPQHELFLICDDIEQTTAKLASHNTPCAEIEDAGWGLLTRITLPSGATLGIYEAKYTRIKN